MKLSKYVFYLFSLTLIPIGCSTDDAIPMNLVEQIATLAIRVEDDNLFFGEVVQNIEVSKTLTLTNNGNGSLEVAEISVPDGFSVDTSSFSIEPGASTEIIVTFKPNELKEFSGDLKISSNATNEVNTIPCSGKGISDIFEGDISITTQEEIDAFGAKGYKTITGELCIGLCDKNFGTETITNLRALSDISSVKDLQISHAKKLTDLDGIQQMVVANGIRLNGNDELANIDALINHTDMTGVVTIFDNASLENIDGLSNLTEVAGIFIGNNPWLKNIDSLSKLSEIEFFVIIRDNVLLQNFNGLRNITAIGTSLELVGSPLVANLDALEKVTSIGEGLRIGSLSEITNLRGLRNTTNVGEIISITGNSLLNDFCDILPLLQATSFATISYNRYNPTPQEIQNGACFKDVPANVYHGNLSLSDDEALAYFQDQGFTTIVGNLRIFENGDGITNGISSLSALENLTTVTGELNIYNTSITNLDGLENLRELGTFLRIDNNLDLTDFCGIAPLFQRGNGSNFDYIVRDNAFNPSQRNLRDGVCSQ